MQWYPAIPLAAGGSFAHAAHMVPANTWPFLCPAGGIPTDALHEAPAARGIPPAAGSSPAHAVHLVPAAHGLYSAMGGPATSIRNPSNNPNTGGTNQAWRSHFHTHLWASTFSLLGLSHQLQLS